MSDDAALTDCGQTLVDPCTLNEIGERQIGYGCHRHWHRRCSGFTGGYDDALYTCLCRCHTEGAQQ